MDEESRRSGYRQDKSANDVVHCLGQNTGRDRKFAVGQSVGGSVPCRDDTT